MGGYPPEIFVQALRDHGLVQFDNLLLTSDSQWEVQQERLAEWLLSLPKPVGIRQATIAKVLRFWTLVDA